MMVLVLALLHHAGIFCRVGLTRCLAGQPGGNHMCGA
jgi:hypothetical protein